MELHSQSLNRAYVRFNSFKIMICDVIGRNQSQGAKHERAEICILSKKVKIDQCHFLYIT